MQRQVRACLLLGAATAVWSGTASAVVLNYTANMQTLNNAAQIIAGGGVATGFTPSTVTGTSTATVDTVQQTLRIRYNLTGVEPGIPHLAHIHGNLVNNMVPGSGVRDSRIPTLAQDVDRDGFIEVIEGAATYGPILVDLGDINTADGNPNDSNLSYDQTFAFANLPFAPVNRFDPNGPKFGLVDVLGDDLMQLDQRHTVVHGLTVPFEIGNAGAAPNEVDGTTTFLPIRPEDNGDPFEGTIALPVANGEFVLAAADAVPEPGTLALLAGGLGTAGWLRRRKR